MMVMIEVVVPCDSSGSGGTLLSLVIHKYIFF